MFRKTTNEFGDDGRRLVVTTEEGPSRPSNNFRSREVFGEAEEVIRSRRGPWEVTRVWIRAVGLWVMVAAAIVEAALAFRLGLLAGGANPANGFVDFIYDVSGPLVQPFEGIAANRSVDGGVFEPAAAIAMAVYLVAALLVVAVLWAASAAPSPAGERTATSRSHRQASAVRED